MPSDTCLVCISDMDNSSKTCRLVVRDECGRYVWDNFSFYQEGDATPDVNRSKNVLSSVTSFHDADSMLSALQSMIGGLDVEDDVVDEFFTQYVVSLLFVLLTIRYCYGLQQSSSAERSAAPLNELVPKGTIKASNSDLEQPTTPHAESECFNHSMDI